MKTWFRSFILALVVTLGATINTFAQTPVNITVTQTDTSRFPQVDVYISVTDANGNPVRNVPASAFQVQENGKPVAASATTRSGELGPINTVLVVDHSGSMGRSNKMAGAKQAATTFVNQMRPGDRTALIQFDTDIETLQSFTEDKNALVAAIQRLEPRGNTAMYDALGQANKYFESVQGRKAVIVVTDGMDNASRLNRDGVVNLSTAGGFSIYTVGLGERGIGTSNQEGIDESVLQEIARASQGDYYYAPDANQLSVLYQQLATRIQNEYKLTYTSSAALRDGLKRGIVVTAPGYGATRADYNPGGVIPEVEPQGWSWLWFLLALVLLVALFLAPQGLRWANARATSGSASTMTAAVPAPRAASRVRLTNGASAPVASAAPSASRPSRVKIKKPATEDPARQQLPWDEDPSKH